MAQSNKTFGGDHPTWANACVGNNGFPGVWDYAKGFSVAANLLIEQVIQERGQKYFVDELVYPICFNMRHSIELRLKAAVSQLISIRKIRGQEIAFNLDSSHDIGVIWQFFSHNAVLTDDRYPEIISQLAQKISDFSKIDATGQTFRYPFDSQSQKHLVDVGIINFYKLKKGFAELEQSLDELHRLNLYLTEEYCYKTFTKKLSRKNIFSIAAQLPSRQNWKDDSFDTIRNRIKISFGISSNELSKCIKIIEEHHELAPTIGISIELLGVNEQQIMEFIELWLELHDLPSDFDPVDFDENKDDYDAWLSSMTRNAEIRQKVWAQIQPKLSAELLAGIYALFYFARELDFAEHYTLIYKDYLGEAQAALASSENSIRTEYFHLFEKTNAIYNILQSLYFLKKNNIAERLVSEHNLENKFSWIDAARSGAMFSKPNYCGYLA